MATCPKITQETNGHTLESRVRGRSRLYIQAASFLSDFLAQLMDPYYQIQSTTPLIMVVTAFQYPLILNCVYNVCCRVFNYADLTILWTTSRESLLSPFETCNFLPKGKACGR